MRRKSNLLLLLFAILLSFILRFWQLGDISFGLHADEASQAYNAFSILKTGKDMYGKSFPVLFRANGSYQPPVYTYLTIFPVLFFGNTIFAARFVSALSGVFLVLLSFFLWYLFGCGKKKERFIQGAFAAFFVAISPWSIHFSRLAVEGNLVVLIFGLGIFFTLLYLKKRISSYLILGFLFLGIATHTYYTERATSFFYIFGFLFLFKEYLFKDRKPLIYSIFVFLLFLIPHVYIANTGALTKRLMQVSYLSNSSFANLNYIQKSIFIINNFLDHYFQYFSPKNLFFNPGNNLGKVSPNLSVFLPLYFLFLLLGIRGLSSNIGKPLFKVLIFLSFITPIPAGLTGDAFYPLRVLSFLWVLTNMVSYGFYLFFSKIKSNLLRFFFVFGLLIYSLFFIYTSRFVFYRQLMVGGGGSFPYLKLVAELDKYKDKKVVIDSNDRSWGVGIVFAYLKRADPKEIQIQLQKQMDGPYYSSSVNPYNIFTISNIIIKPINWSEACDKNLLIVGDKYSVSEEQVSTHNLSLVFIVNDVRDKPYLFAYRPNSFCNH